MVEEVNLTHMIAQEVIAVDVVEVFLDALITVVSTFS
jgi:hypothetical protein